VSNDERSVRDLEGALQVGHRITCQPAKELQQVVELDDQGDVRLYVGQRVILPPGRR
jgi:hypothetical protein